MEIDAGDISSERACKEGNRIGKLAQFSNAAERNGGEQRQHATLDVLPKCASSAAIPRAAATARKPPSSLSLLIVPGEIALTVTPSAATVFAIEAVRAFIAAFAAE